MENKRELVIAIMNRGYAEAAMNAAKLAGATGGTITHGRGTGGKDAQKLWGVSIHPEKEMLLILVASEARNGIMKAISQAVVLETDGQGICFSLPVEAAVGINAPAPSKPDPTDNVLTANEPNLPAENEEQERTQPAEPAMDNAESAGTQNNRAE